MDGDNIMAGSSKYDDAFKEEVKQMVVEGKTFKEISEEKKIAVQTIRDWVNGKKERKSKKGTNEELEAAFETIRNVIKSKDDEIERLKSKLYKFKELVGDL